jgi:hypothetical protein
MIEPNINGRNLQGRESEPFLEHAEEEQKRADACIGEAAFRLSFSVLQGGEQRPEEEETGTGR